MKVGALARSPRAIARQWKVWKFLSDALEATTSYPEKFRESYPAARKLWRELYGSKSELKAREGSLLSADGKFGPETKFEVVRKFSHQPGEIIVSDSRKSTGSDRVKYVVQPDHSLRKTA